MICLKQLHVTCCAQLILFHCTAAYAFNEAHQEANKYRAEYSLPVYLELLGDHPFTATLMVDMGMSYQVLGDYDSAIKFLRDALRMRKNSLGDHQETARSFHDLGKVNLQGNSGIHVDEFLECIFSVLDWNYM